MFKDFIENANNQFSTGNSIDIKTVALYPISEYNLEGIKFLIDNCEIGNQENVNVSTATVHTSLWLGDFLDRHYDKISYVCKLPAFDVLRVDCGKIIAKRYNVKPVEFKSEEELNKFFEDGKWKTFVIYTIVKLVDLSTMDVRYNVRYADISEEYEVRDNKISSILN